MRPRAGSIHLAQPSPGQDRWVTLVKVQCTADTRHCWSLVRECGDKDSITTAMVTTCVNTYTGSLDLALQMSNVFSLMEVVIKSW